MGSADSLKRFAEKLAEEEAKRLADPVKYNCKVSEDMDSHFRSTFFKLHKGMNGLLDIGDWVIDPDGVVKDIVHKCDGELGSPTVLLSGKTKRAHSISKYADFEDMPVKWKLVCVSCGASPTEDVIVIIDLLERRKANIEGTLDDITF
jgi:hypothetical protein